VVLPQLALLEVASVEMGPDAAPVLRQDVLALAMLLLLLLVLMLLLLQLLVGVALRALARCLLRGVCALSLVEVVFLPLQSRCQNYCSLQKPYTLTCQTPRGVRMELHLP
jgi:hypothetical protein